MESLEALRTPHGRYGLTTDTGCWSRLSMLPNCWICFVRQSRLSARGACAIGHVAESMTRPPKRVLEPSRNNPAGKAEMR
jgi:hypothetical protein